MKASQPKNLVSKARKEFRVAAERARDTGKSAQAADGMNRQAKMKFKQAKKWARLTKKLAKKAKKKAADAEQFLQRAGERLKKAEKKALKGLKKASAKTRTAKPAKIVKAPVKRKPVKRTKPRPTPKIKVAALPPSTTASSGGEILNLPSTDTDTTPVTPPSAS